MQGKVKKWDAATQTITLEDGTQLTVPATVKESAQIKEGAMVKASSEEKDGGGRSPRSRSPLSAQPIVDRAAAYSPPVVRPHHSPASASTPFHPRAHWASTFRRAALSQHRPHKHPQ